MPVVKPFCDCATVATFERTGPILVTFGLRATDLRGVVFCGVSLLGSKACTTAFVLVRMALRVSALNVRLIERLKTVLRALLVMWFAMLSRCVWRLGKTEIADIPLSCRPRIESGVLVPVIHGSEFRLVRGICG